VKLIEHFDQAAQRFPERAFLVDVAGTRSYRDVQAASHRIALALRRQGVARGARVAVLAPNMARAFECVIGLLRAGAVWVPVSTRNALADTQHTIGRTGTELLFFHPEHADIAARLRDECPALKTLVALDADFDRWLAPEGSTFDEDPPGAPDEVVTLFSSGGTTGRPKGVMTTQAGWETMIAGTLLTQPHPHPVHLVAAPMTHAAGGAALAMLPMGATHVLLPAFEPLEVMRAIQTHRVSHLFLPPTAIVRLLEHPDVRRHDYASLRYFNYASAPMDPRRVEQALEVFGPVMVNFFGQTETGLGVTCFPPEEHARALAEGRRERFASCGRATPFFRVAVMDDDGRLLPTGARGEVVVRGASVMKGYLDDPEESARVGVHGWHHTGDIGWLDDEGWLYLVDRKRELIVSGGFNVFPSEVETVLRAHPAVADCAVIGVPDPLWGEAVKAVLELNAGRVLDAAELREFCRARLASHQVPKSFEAIDRLPRSAVGKLLKRELRERWWAGQARRI